MTGYEQSPDYGGRGLVRQNYALIALLIALFMSLGGCGEDQQRAVASCELRTREAGIDPASVKFSFGADDGYRRMKVCMRAAGYEFESDHDPSKAECSKLRTDTQNWLVGVCYSSTSVFGRLLSRFTN